MSLYWRDAANVQRTAGAVYMRDADSVQRSVDQIRVRGEDGNYVEIYKQGLRLAASPDSAFGSSASHTGPIYTNGVTVSVAGGTAPYNHSWAVPFGINATAPYSGYTAFIGHPTAGDEVSGTATDTVTDVNGVFSTIDVPVSISRTSYA